MLSLAAFSQVTEVKGDSVAMRSALADTLRLKQLSLDSAMLAQKANEALKDSLAQRLNGQEVSLDSAALATKVQGLASETLQEELGIVLSGLPTDSATIANQLQSTGTEHLEEETGITLSGIPTDSAAFKREASSLAKEEFTNQTGIASPDITLDSTTFDQVKQEAVTRAETALKDTEEFKALDGSDSELGKLTDAKKELEMTREQLQQMKSKKEMKQKMASRAKGFIAEHSEQFQEVQSQMTKVKQKYASVPNSNDLSTAQKRNSLKGEPFWKRLVLGGNFNLTETNPVTIDFSPVIGW